MMRTVITHSLSLFLFSHKHAHKHTHTRQNLNGHIYWMYDFERYAHFAVVPNSQFLIEGSWLTQFGQSPPSPINSGSPMTLNVSGRNLVNDGPGAVKFKFINLTFCEAAAEKDDTFTFVGGAGRSMDRVGGSLLQFNGQVTFILAYPFRASPLVNFSPVFVHFSNFVCVVCALRLCRQEGRGGSDESVYARGILACVYGTFFAHAYLSV